MENLNQVLLSGGFYHCTTEWNSKPGGKDGCYKLYHPIAGNAQIRVNGQWHNLAAGNMYFINGFALDENRCSDYMEVYWLHFIPESQLLNMHFSNIKPVYCWDKYSDIPFTDFKRIPELFENPDQKENRLMETINFSIVCKTNALILKLIAEMTENQQSDLYGMSYDLYNKLEAAVNFIDSNFNKSIRLEQMARKVFLNPAYFLRLFKKCFKMTPNEYVVKKRLNEACRLLTRTNMTIREIAESTGYCNQFYFAKVFKRYFQKTPHEYRTSKLLP